MSRGILRSFLNLQKKVPLFLSSRVNSQLIRGKHVQSKHLYNMNEAYLRYDEGDETFQFTFRYANPNLHLDRQFNMVRKPIEPISHFLHRLDANLDKIIAKKKMKQVKKGLIPEKELEKGNNVELGKISLMRNDSKIDLSVPCTTLFDNPSEIILHVFENTYKIKVNVPWITSLVLSDSILAGFPTYPSVFEALHIDKDKSTFTWYKNCSKAVPGSNAYESGWEQAGQGFLYTPSTEDIKYRLKLRCLPANAETIGPVMESESAGVVEAGPGQCPFETRHLFTEEKLSGKSFRVTSYNLLADVYASTEYSKDVLFPYCPSYALAMNYRKHLIVKELLGYNSDIICLQEVDRKVFETDLYPLLSTLYYDGVFRRKGIDLSEGLATFYDERRFDKLRTESRVMSQDVHSPGFSDVWNRIQNETVKERFLARNTTVQATVLRSKENPLDILVVGNTHLYFQPDADHIRLLQGFYALTYCQEIARQTEREQSDGNVQIVLCGDFNSTPDCGIYQLMTTKHVTEDHKDWKSNSDQIVENISLSTDYSFASACGTPEYTNFTADFADCLDYIYYETDKLKLRQFVPLPSKEELSFNTAIPSVVFPSDHVSLCADLEWKTQ